MDFLDDDDDGSWWVAPDPEPEVEADEEDQGEEEQPERKELKSILKSKSQLLKTVGTMSVKKKAQMSNANVNKAKNTLDCWNSTAIKAEATRKEREKMTEGQKPLAFNNVFKTKAMLLKNVNNMSDSTSKKATNETNPWMKPTKKALENDHETLQQERERKKMEMEQVFIRIYIAILLAPTRALYVTLRHYQPHGHNSFSEKDKTPPLWESRSNFTKTFWPSQLAHSVNNGLGLGGQHNF